jgi:hypothetical protein
MSLVPPSLCSFADPYTPSSKAVQANVVQEQRLSGFCVLFVGILHDFLEKKKACLKALLCTR